MIGVPIWITGLSYPDEVGEEETLDRYAAAHDEFMAILEDEEKKQGASQMPLSRVMRNSWASRSIWFTRCLDSRNSMYRLFEQHI